MSSHYFLTSLPALYRVSLPHFPLLYLEKKEKEKKLIKKKPKKEFKKKSFAKYHCPEDVYVRCTKWKIPCFPKIKPGLILIFAAKEVLGLIFRGISYFFHIQKSTFIVIQSCHLVEHRHDSPNPEFLATLFPVEPMSTIIYFIIYLTHYYIVSDYINAYNKR